MSYIALNGQKPQSLTSLPWFQNLNGAPPLCRGSARVNCKGGRGKCGEQQASLKVPLKLQEKKREMSSGLNSLHPI